MIGIPLDDTIKFDKGIDGYPVFMISERADIHKPAQEYFQKIYRDFSIVTAFRLDSNASCFLFSILNPDQTLVQFGLRLSAIDGSEQTISLYYTDFRFDDSSKAIAEFRVPSFVNQWKQLALKVQDDEITLYLDCNKYDTKLHTRNTMELPLESGSTLYLAQGGDMFGEKFVVSNSVVK